MGVLSVDQVLYLWDLVFLYARRFSSTSLIRVFETGQGTVHDEGKAGERGELKAGLLVFPVVALGIVYRYRREWGVLEREGEMDVCVVEGLRGVFSGLVD